MTINWNMSPKWNQRVDGRDTVHITGKSKSKAMEVSEASHSCELVEHYSIIKGNIECLHPPQFAFA